MPKRQRVVRHASNEVQGQGSWVEMRSMDVREAREQRTASLAIYEKHGVPHDTKPEDFDQFPEFVSEFGEFTQASMGKIFVAWNWVDDDDQPLPQPGADGSMDALTTMEISFLTRLMRQATLANEDQKKV